MPQVDPPRVKKGELGHSGTVILDGLIDFEEYNQDLQGVDGIEEFEKMRRSDGTVKAALLAVKLPILSANWFFEPASEEKQDVQVAAFLEDNFFNGLNVSFQQMMREMLRYLDYGTFPFEKVFANREFEGKEYIGLKKIAPRQPKTIEKWTTQDGKDGITQQIDGKQFSIPMEKLVIFVNDKIGDDWWGESLLRAAWQHFWIKKQLYKIDSLKHERQGLGVMSMRVPKIGNQALKVKLRKAIKSIRAVEGAFIEWPSEEDWTLEFMDMKAKGNTDVMPSISHHDRQITKSVLAQFLELGSDDAAGSLALSRDHSSLFFLSLKAVAQYFADTMNAHVIRQLVDMNFSVDEYPKLKFDNIGTTDYSKLGETLSSLSNAKLMHGDVHLEQFLRESLGLPMLDDELVEKLSELQKEQMLITPPDPNEPAENPDKKENQKDLDDDKDIKASERHRFLKAVESMQKDVEKFIETNES